MDSAKKTFILEMFLDNDSTFTTNRIIVAATDVIKENRDNLKLINEMLAEEERELLPPPKRTSGMEILEKMFEIDRPGPILTDGASSSFDNREFYVDTFSEYTDAEYERIFKMKKSTCKELLKFLHDYKEPKNMIIPLEKKLHVFLWVLTRDASFYDAGTQFGLHKSTVSYIFYEIAEIIMEQRIHFITWPSIDEQHITRSKINYHFKFPNCVGFIDACRFKVGSKQNKKREPDHVLLQAVCDESMLFIDIHVGGIGNTKKNRVFKESPLSKELPNFIEFENHLLGDTHYKLRMNLITPFTSDVLLKPEEIKFNEAHWKARVYIGKAFEMLKERFRKLNFIDFNKPDAVRTVLCAACVLHNFIIIHEGNHAIKEELDICDDVVVIDQNTKTAQEKRQFLCDYINYVENTAV